MNYHYDHHDDDDGDDDDDDDDDDDYDADDLRELTSASGRNTSDDHEVWTIFLKCFRSRTALQNR